MTTNTAQVSETIPYATPKSFGPPAKPIFGVMIILAGLATIVLAGCFLIGVLMVVTPQGAYADIPRGKLNMSEIMLVAVLYMISGFCLIGSVFLIRAGTKAVLRSMP